MGQWASPPFPVITPSAKAPLLALPLLIEEGITKDEHLIGSVVHLSKLISTYPDSEALLCSCSCSWRLSHYLSYYIRCSAIDEALLRRFHWLVTALWDPLHPLLPGKENHA